MPLPGMSDGRAFTDYRPSCEINAELMEENNITNNRDYRKFINGQYSVVEN